MQLDPILAQVTRWEPPWTGHPSIAAPLTPTPIPTLIQTGMM